MYKLKIRTILLSLSIVFNLEANIINTAVDYSVNKGKEEAGDISQTGRKEAQEELSSTQQQASTTTRSIFSNEIDAYNQQKARYDASVQQYNNTVTSYNNTKQAAHGIKTGALDEYKKTKGILSTFKSNIRQSIHPCFADNCKTIDGFINCLRTNSVLDYFMEPANFFRKDPKTNDFIYRKVPIVIGLKRKALDGTKDLLEEVETTSVVIKLIHSKTYESFQQVVKSQPNCMRAFCKVNCMTLEKVDPKVLQQQARFFFISPIPIKIGKRTFTPTELQDMSQGEREQLALGYLMDKRNTLISTFCLSESTGGVKLRMFCSQCPQYMHKGEIGLLNTTCSTFDSTQYVEYNTEVANDPTVQAALKHVGSQQQMTIQKAITEAGNGLGAGVDLDKLRGNLNTISHETSSVQRTLR